LARQLLQAAAMLANHAAAAQDRWWQELPARTGHDVQEQIAAPAAAEAAAATVVAV
jgi:hypothetical protein